MKIDLILYHDNGTYTLIRGQDIDGVNVMRESAIDPIRSTENVRMMMPLKSEFEFRGQVEKIIKTTGKRAILRELSKRSS